MRTTHLALPLLLISISCGGGGGGYGNGTTSSSPAILPPVAHAGPDQAVASGASLALDGSTSTDPSGYPLTYSWSAPVGISLSSPSAARPTFTAPTLTPGAAPSSFTFSLVVSDIIAASAPASVTITVNAPAPLNPAPIANAGQNQSVASGSPVTLDGSLSHALAGQVLSYAWTQLGGAPLTLTGAGTAHPSFTAPTVASSAPAATLPFSLVVSDGTASSTAATVTVTVNPSGGVAAPPPPGTPTPAPFDPNPLPVGGSGSKRWQIGAVGGGLYLVDPAAGEASVQGMVIVTLDKGVPPSDTVVTINGVALAHAPLADGRYFVVDPSGPQPSAHPGGRMVLAASSASAGVDRQLVLPCASDVAMDTTPAVGASLSGIANVQLTFSGDLTLNPIGPVALAGVTPMVMLGGYDPTTRALSPGSTHPVGAGLLGMSFAVGTTAAQTWLVDVRWPGLFIPDGGDSGAFCGLAKRWTYSK